ncbi:MAG TPA: 4-hydroxy-tetrahydrodipicolinate reductase [Candidatus Caccousia avistercoris]|nr:4-hydroxy-tetrahydrodipicolinate reductase [Candidatus Caccousia avistercoris]
MKKKIVLSGCSGKMGHAVAALVRERQDCEICAGIDLVSAGNEGFPVYASVKDFPGGADVLVDFSHPSLLPSLLEYGQSSMLPLVLCTTGYSREQVAAVHEAAARIPIFYSGNMSLGINLLIELSKRAAQVLGPGFDIEIVEKHHNQKIDAPSGTALMLADAVSQVEPEEMHYMYDRHSQRKKREKNEIGIHSVRGGTIVGEHEVIFAGHHEVITLSHSAQSKEVFAAGAVNAAVFLSTQAPGLYSMPDLLKE